MIHILHLARTRTIFSVLLILAIGSLAPLMASAETAEEGLAGFRTAFLMQLDRLDERDFLLVEELPEEAFATSSGPEIHTLAACYSDSLATRRTVLVALRAMKRRSSEEPLTTRDEIVAEMKAVSKALRRAMERITAEKIDGPVDLLGRRRTARALLLFMLTRQAEGLGHASLHAEVLGHPPRWIREQRDAAAHPD